MHWLNLELKTLHSPEYIGSDPTQRATWLALLGYCAEQENGGTIRDCSGWKDRQWQQTCGVTLEEVKGDSALWRWEDGTVVVTFYPTSQETEVQAKREGGRRGGAASAQAKIEAQAEVTSSSASSIPSSLAFTKGKVREGKVRERKEKEVVAPPPLPFPSEAFRLAWETWLSHKRALREKPYTPDGLEGQFKRLTDMGEARAIEAIRFSVAQNWKGIFEEKGGSGSARAPQKPLANAARGSDPHKYDHLIERSPNNG